MTEYEKNLDGLKRMRIAMVTATVGGDKVFPFLEGDEDDEETDCEIVFDYGRGQGIFEMCNEVSKILCPDT